MWFGIIVAGLFGFSCILGIVVLISAKKSPSSDNTGMETPDDHYFRICNLIHEVREKIIAKRSSLVENMRPISDRMIEIMRESHAMLMGLIAQYEGDSTIDADFAQLLSIYKKRENNVNDEYLTALQKCREKNLSETKRLCQLDDERKKLRDEHARLMAESDEWGDVLHLKAREVWTNPECEKLYNQLRELENDAVYKEREEKEKRWEDYDSGSVLASQNSISYRIGRNKDNIAIWNANTFIGQVISIDDVMYFQVSEKTTTGTYTHSGGPSKLGTAINEAIWGTAAATASAMQKNQQSTTTRTDRKAMLYFKYELGIDPLEVSGDGEVNRLIAMMPEKQK